MIGNLARRSEQLHRHLPREVPRQISGSNCRYLNRPETEGARASARLIRLIRQIATLPMEERFTASDFNWTQLDPCGDNHQLIPAQYPLRFSLGIARFIEVVQQLPFTIGANQICKGGMVHKVDIRVFSWIVIFL